MFKTIVSIITILITLCVFILGIIGLAQVQIGLAAVCFILSGILSYFCYTDIKSYLGDKS